MTNEERRKIDLDAFRWNLQNVLRDQEFTKRRIAALKREIVQTGRGKRRERIRAKTERRRRAMNRIVLKERIKKIRRLNAQRHINDDVMFEIRAGIRNLESEQ